MNPDEKTCPYCGETIKAVAIRCKHCHADLGDDRRQTTDDGRPVSQPPNLNSQLSLLGVSEVNELLTSLVERSLVTFDEITGRDRLLETVRQYARDRLVESGEVRDWRDRHLACFCSLIEEAGGRMTGLEQVEWLDRLEVEHDNIRAALEWSLESDLPFDVDQQPASGDRNTDLGLRMAASLGKFWEVRGHVTEGRARFGDLLSATQDERSAVRAEALAGAGGFAWRQGDYAVAMAMHEESLAIRRELEDMPGVASSLNGIGLVAWQLEDFDRALAHINESLAIRRALDDRPGIAVSLNTLGTAHHFLGNYRAALPLYEECLEISRELGDLRIIGICLGNLAHAARELGSISVAGKRYAECLEISVLLGDRLLTADAIEGCAELAAKLGRPLRASCLWGAAERIRQEIHMPISRHELARHKRILAEARAALADDSAFDAAWAVGRAMKVEQAVECVLQAEVLSPPNYAA